MSLQIPIIEQDILTAKETIIVQQVNCLGGIGGLAEQIAKKYPTSKQDYKAMVKAEKELKGTTKGLLGETLFSSTPDGKVIANIFGQYGVRKNKKDKTLQTNYDSLKVGLLKVRSFAEQGNFSVAIPYNIGCNLANGDWSIVEKDIYEVFAGFQNTITFYKYPSTKQKKDFFKLPFLNRK